MPGPLLTGASGPGIATALRRVANGHNGPRFAVADLLAALGDHGFGLLVLALAVPNAVPGPMIPGFSVPFAFGIAALGLQIAAGRRTPWLPRRFAQLSMKHERFRSLIDRAEPLLLRIERWLRPRSSLFTDSAGERLVGVALVALSGVLALPVPFGNSPVAFSIIIIALGLLEGDGLALMLGVVAGLVAAVWNAVLIFAGAELFVAAAHLA